MVKLAKLSGLGTIRLRMVHPTFQKWAKLLISHGR